jgi:hypothetical protein
VELETTDNAINNAIDNRPDVRRLTAPREMVWRPAFEFSIVVLLHFGFSDERGNARQ